MHTLGKSMDSHHSQTSLAHMKLTEAYVDNLPPFEHRPLEHADQIRLLCLHPGSFEEPIECSLYQTSLDFDEYRYSALSYVWGDAQLVHTISCNGQKLGITHNIHSALKRLRQESKELLLWADAICINQSTESNALRERAIQVQMMHIIYGCAEKVIVDMGEADEDTANLMSMLKHFNKVPVELWAQPLESRLKLVLATLCMPELVQGLISDPQLTGPLGTFWSSFARFLGRPWIKRMWMFQEFVLAKELVFMLDTELYPGEFLTQNIFSACELSRHNLIFELDMGLSDLSNSAIRGDILVAYGELKIKANARQNHLSSAAEMRSLANLMYLTNHLQASNLQDKVYALLSLIEPPGVFPVIYTESSDETAMRTSLLLLEQCPLYLLYRCVGLNSTRASWSAALEYRHYTKLETRWTPNGTNNSFNACGDSPLSMILNSSNTSLTVKGVKIGRVKDMATILHQLKASDPSNFDFNAVFDIYKWIESQVSSSPCGYTTEDFCRALVADLVLEGEGVWRSREFSEFQASLNTFARYASQRVGEGEKSEQPAGLDTQMEEIRWWSGHCLPLCMEWRLAVLDSGRPCLVPGNACVGDVLCIMLGAPLPLVLRPCDDFFRIVGCGYIHDMMDGQLFQDRTDPLDITEFVIS